MPSTSGLDPTLPLAPSELVLLHGDQFAKKARLGNIRLLHTDASVSVSQLGEAALAAAILACESTGDIRLEMRQKKALMGLRKVNMLVAVPAGDQTAWPASSLESQVGPIAERQGPGGKGSEVSDVLYAWLGADSSSPWQRALELIMSGLASRGVLEAEEETKLKVFTVTNYRLPERTAATVAAQPVEPTQELLQTCASDRPDIWQALLNELKSAIKSRTEQDNSSSVDF